MCEVCGGIDPDCANCELLDLYKRPPVTETPADYTNAAPFNKRPGVTQTPPRLTNAARSYKRGGHGDLEDH